MKEFPEMENLQEKELMDVENKEKLWADTFWSEYKPGYDYSKFFDWLESRFEKDWYFFPFLDNDDNKKIFEIINLVKNNNYKIDIKFLESLSREQKYLISYSFLEIFLVKWLWSRYNMWKSLLIWMIYWYSYKYKNYVRDLYNLNIERNIEEVWKNFEWFDSLYFNQALEFLRRHYVDNSKKGITEEFLFSVIMEYNIIKNLDGDINLFNKENIVNLWEDFSLWTFYARGHMWFWFEKKRWSYSLDKNGKKTDIMREWKKIMVDENGRKIYWAEVLDRDDDSLYELDENGDKKLVDASWIMYDVYLDSPSWVALFYKGSPLASMCFFVRNWNEIFINQIQKVVYYEYDRYGRRIWKHYSKEVNNIDWKNILYNVIVNLAKKYNISRIIIQWWENNRWIKEIYEDYETYYFKNNKSSWLDESIPKKNKGKIHLDPEIAHRIYDVFAESLWFQQDMEWNREKDV